MSSSLLLVLIIVVWVFVLAPLVVNKREPIRRTSEGLGKTRLLHRGGDELAASRRPRFTGDDVRRRGDADDDLLETVDAEPDDIDGLLVDDEPRDGARRRDGARAGAGDANVDAEAPAEDDGSVIEGDVVYELEPAHQAEAGRDDDAVPGDDADSHADAVAIGLADPADAGEDGVAETGDESTPAAPAAEEQLDEGLDAHVAAADFLAARDRRTAREKMADLASAAEPPADDYGDRVEDGGMEDAPEPGSAVAVAADDRAGDDADAAEPVDASDRDLHDLPEDQELTADDYAWAEARRGRGGFDPVADARYAETRFARRRRTVYGLLAVTVLAFVVGVVQGGWWWAAPAAAVALTVAYLVTLRRTVVAEQELRARRIAGLKRRRMGVRSREAEELGIPERLRRPGAIVVELDDEDPDFADVPFSEDDGYLYGDDRRASGL